jgi:hypothetical protein
MTYQQVADELGIPYEFFSAALAVQTIALQSNCAVIIDTRPAPKAN